MTEDEVEEVFETDSRDDHPSRLRQCTVLVGADFKPDPDFPVCLFDISAEAGAGASPGQTSIAVILISDYNGKLVVVFPHAAWHRTLSKRLLPPGVLIKPVAVDILCDDRADPGTGLQAERRVWLGQLEPSAEERVVLASEPSEPVEPDVLSAMSASWTRCSESSCKSCAGIGLGSGSLSSPSGHSRRAHCRDGKAGKPRTSAEDARFSSSAQTTSRCQCPVGERRRGGVAGGSPTSACRRDCRRGLQQFFDHCCSKADRDCCAPHLTAQKRQEKTLEALLDGVGSAGGGESSQVPGSRKYAAALRALRRTLTSKPEEIYAAIERNMVEDFQMQAQLPGSSAIPVSARAWLELRSRVQNYTTPVRLLWGIAGIHDALRAGQVAEARARSALLLAQGDQLSIDRGSWIIAGELSLEEAPPAAAFAAHTLPGDSEAPYSRLIDGRWFDLFLQKLNDYDNLSEKKKKLSSRRNPQAPHVSNPAGAESGKPDAKKKAKSKGKGKSGGGGAAEAEEPQAAS